MLITKNRRNFLKNLILGTAGVTSASMLSACTSFDSYLFEDRFNFNDEVMIVGGGISGLYLAHKLRLNKTEFRLFEGSSSFGGRIKSNAGSDYGASLFSVTDKNVKILLKELSLQTRDLDKDFFYLTQGMQSLPDSLIERIIGLIPYRNFRLRWQLVEIRKMKSGYELVFEHPSGQKRFNCKKLALAIPPTQWMAIKGLMELPEMQSAAVWLETLSVENTIKLIIPASAAINLTNKPIIEFTFEDMILRQVVKKGNSSSMLEIEVSYPLRKLKSAEDIYDRIRKKLQIEYSFEKLTAEQYFDWNQVKLIGGAKFKNLKSLTESKNNNFQIIGDFTPSSSLNTVEGALQSASRASVLLL